MEQIKLNWGGDRGVYTVTDLTAEIRGLLGKSFENIWVAGEISGTRMPGSGHAYFTLKDAKAQLKCVCYKTALRWVKFKPRDGIEVLARGRLDVYEARGEYQFIVETLEPQGYGQLQLAFEQLKKKLELEGLFAAGRKRKLPAMPARIGIVTSPTGAVIRDMVQVLGRRFPGIHVRLYPALVQGAGAVESVVEGIEYFSRSGWAEVVIVGRGGGSLEDLWTFNEEAVARAIVACAVPVVSAVGHETDFTIADFVADLRAPTPSAAAEMVVPTRVELMERVEALLARQRRAVRLELAEAAALVHRLGIERAGGELRRRLGRAAQRVDELEAASRETVRKRMGWGRQRWQGLEKRLQERNPSVRMARARGRLETLYAALERRMSERLTAAGRKLEQATGALKQLSPLAVLERGYAIVQDERGQVIRQSAETAEGAELSVRLWSGKLKTRVTAVE